MDVLEYYNPSVDWSRFQQGPVSDDVWNEFGDLVLLSQAHKHWMEVMRGRQVGGPARSLYEESAYQRRKQKNEWRHSVRSAEDHMHRAAFLGAEKAWKIANLVQSRPESPDWYFSLALIKALGSQFLSSPITGQERANFDVLAFEEFDALQEVSDDPDTMAQRWRQAAGYRDLAA